MIGDWFDDGYPSPLLTLDPTDDLCDVEDDWATDYALEEADDE